MDKNLNEYVKKYVWDRFKHSPFTIGSLISLILVPLGISIADLPTALQVFSIVPLGLVGTSYWWYHINRGEELAEEATLKYQKWYQEKKHKQIMKEFSSIDLSHLPRSQQSLKGSIWSGYQSFLEALSQQEITSEEIYNRFESKAQRAFLSSIELLKEVSDLLVVQRSTSLKKLEKQKNKASEANKSKVQKSIDQYKQNDLKIQELIDSIEHLILSFENAKLNLASATSNFDSQYDLGSHSDDLNNAIEASKIVQERLSRFGTNNSQSIIKKYRSKENV